MKREPYFRTIRAGAQKSKTAWCSILLVLLGEHRRTPNSGRINAFQSKDALLVASLVSLVTCVCSHAQTNTAPKAVKSAYGVEGIPYSVWSSQSWTGNDLPYQKIRQNIDQSINNKQITVANLDAYQAELSKSSQPNIALFRWAYAAYSAMKQTPPILQKSQPGLGVFDQFPDPHTYNYTRLKFLYDVPGRRNENLIPLARRLIKKDPEDYYVIYSLVRLYDPWSGSLTKQETLFYANKIVKLYPSRPQTYASLGGVYYKSWLKTKSATDGKSAVNYYKQYLKLTSKDDPWKDQAKLLMSDIGNFQK